MGRQTRMLPTVIAVFAVVAVSAQATPSAPASLLRHGVASRSLNLDNSKVDKGSNKARKCMCQHSTRPKQLSLNEEEDEAGTAAPADELKGLGFGHAQPVPLIPAADLPSSFDWSNVMGVNFLLPSWNQHIPTYCGSCYAHGTLAAVQDRIKISKQGRAPDITLSRQSFINCGPAHGFGAGCHGGNPTDIYNFMHEIGLPDETCNNYAAHAMESTCELESLGMCMNCMVDEDETGKLVTNCWPVEKYTRYYVTDFGVVSGEEAIMNEIFQRGPVTCGIISSFKFDYGYDGGVFSDWADPYSEVDPVTGLPVNVTDELINHDVEITGWGVSDDGVKFWQIRNSWGTYWGEHGFFKYERGIDLNMIESYCYFAIPEAKEEQLVNNGELTGYMDGLKVMEVASTAAADRRTFRDKLHENDWSVLPLPPMLYGIQVGLTGPSTTSDGGGGGGGVSIHGGQIASSLATGDVATEIRSNTRHPSGSGAAATTGKDEVAGSNPSGSTTSGGFFASVFLLDPVAVALGVFMGVAMALLCAIVMLVVARRRRANYDLVR